MPVDGTDCVRAERHNPGFSLKHKEVWYITSLHKCRAMAPMTWKCDNTGLLPLSSRNLLDYSRLPLPLAQRLALEKSAHLFLLLGQLSLFYLD